MGNKGRGEKTKMNKGRREGQGERANNNKEFSYVFVWCLFRSLIGPKSGQNPKKKNIQICSLTSQTIPFLFWLLSSLFRFFHSDGRHTSPKLLSTPGLFSCVGVLVVLVGLGWVHLVLISFPSGPRRCRYLAERPLFEGRRDNYHEFRE